MNYPFDKTTNYRAGASFPDIIQQTNIWKNSSQFLPKPEPTAQQRDHNPNFISKQYHLQSLNSIQSHEPVLIEPDVHDKQSLASQILVSRPSSRHSKRSNLSNNSQKSKRSQQSQQSQKSYKSKGSSTSFKTLSTSR